MIRCLADMSTSRSRARSRRSGRRSTFGKGGIGRRVICWLLGILGVLLLALVVGYYQALAYLQSDSFRALMEEKLSHKGKTEKVTFTSNLDIDGGRLTLAGGEMQRLDACRRITVENITADLKRQRLWDGCLAFSKINAESLTLHANLKKQPLPGAASQPKQSGDSRKADTASTRPNWVEIAEVECRDTNLNLAKGENLLLMLQHCAVKAEPIRPSDFRSWNLLLTGGKATTSFPLLREFGVKIAAASIDGKRIRLQRCALQLTPGVGELRAAGDYNLQSKAWQAQLEVTKADLGILLPETWRRRIKGTLFANLRISGNDNRIHNGRGDISLSNAVIEGLPILSDLPFGNTTPYRTVELETAECAIMYPFSESQHHISDAWLFDHIDLRAKGDKLRVTGRILVGEDKQLAGTLRVGLPESDVALLESINADIVNKIFNAQGAPGFRWLTINLSGTVDNPVEDLSARLSTELRAILPQAAGKAADQAIRSLGGTLADMLRGSPTGASSAAGTNTQASADGGNRPGSSSDAAEPGDGPVNSSPRNGGQDGAQQRRVTPADIIDSATNSAAESIQRGLRKLF